jgi:hypothetical protein
MKTTPDSQRLALPLIKCAHEAWLDELTPERVAEVLLDEEAQTARCPRKRSPPDRGDQALPARS